MSKSSANILVFGWSILIISLIGIGLLTTLALNTPGNGRLWISGECPLGESYYQRSDLTRLEKSRFSPNAVAVSAIDSSSQRLRIILDFELSGGLRDKVSIKVIAKPENSSNLTDFSIYPLLNGVKSDSSSSGKTESGAFYNFFESGLTSQKNLIGILVTKADKCELKINDLASVEKGTWPIKQTSAGNDVIKSAQDDKLTLQSGYNYIGSADWAYLKSLTDKHFKLLDYDTVHKKWVNAPEVGEPGRAFALYNPSNAVLSVEKPAEYRVPDDINSPVIKTGWNLLYNYQDRSIDDMKVYFNPDNKNFISSVKYSIKDLIDKDLASKTVYFLKDGKLTNADLPESKTISAGAFWFFVKKEPFDSYKQINLNLAIGGAGETYGKGEFIPLKIVVRNDDDTAHLLIDSGIDDPCQIAVTLTDAAQRVYEASNQKICPLWPNLVELSPGAKKEYNHTWKAPNSLSGEIKVQASLDYSRLNGQKLINESKIFIK